VKNHDLISSLATLYSVSEDAIMYRLSCNKLISKQYYESVRKGNIRNINSESSGGNFYYTHMSYLGKPYLRQVFNMYYSGKITVSQIGLYAQIKPIHISKFASNIYGGAF
jgi:Zn-dependent peptidase ImmA (M78 family)